MCLGHRDLGQALEVCGSGLGKRVETQVVRDSAVGEDDGRARLPAGVRDGFLGGGGGGGGGEREDEEEEEEGDCEESRAHVVLHDDAIGFVFVLFGIVSLI